MSTSAEANQSDPIVYHKLKPYWIIGESVLNITSFHINPRWCQQPCNLNAIKLSHEYENRFLGVFLTLQYIPSLINSSALVRENMSAD